MKVVAQRVERAEVRTGGRRVAAIGAGLLLLVAVEEGDTEEDLTWCATKAAGLRVFPDREGRMSLSPADVGGEILAVSQFTLAASLRRGRRPSFDGAAAPGVAEAMYGRFLEILQSEGVPVQAGVFGADMDVESVNRGPVTILVDSRERRRPRSAGA